MDKSIPRRLGKNDYLVTRLARLKPDYCGHVSRRATPSANGVSWQETLQNACVIFVNAPNRLGSFLLVRMMYEM